MMSAPGLAGELTLPAKSRHLRPSASDRSVDV